jgi:hypothetical protein
VRPVPRVARWTEQQVGRVPLRRELGKVGLADHDRAGGAEARDDHRVVPRLRRRREDLRSERRPHPGDIGHVLHQERQPREHTGLGAAGDRGVEPSRVVERLVGAEGNDRPQVGVQCFDPAQRLGYELVCAQAPLADRSGQRTELHPLVIAHPMDLRQPGPAAFASATQRGARRR